MINDETGKPSRGTAKRLGRLVCYSLVSWPIGVTVIQPVWGQDKKTAPLEIVNQPPDHRSAHAHNADMSCCAPCAPEANRDPDVFKRPCFVRALAKSRQGFHSHYAQTAARGIDIKVSGDAIPVHSVKGFQALLDIVMHPDYLPRTWDEIKFTIPYPVVNTTEVREGVRMLVGHEVSRGTQPGTLYEGDPIQAGWTVRGIGVLPLTWYRQEGSPGRAYIRLCLHGDDRLKLGLRPQEFTRSSKDFGAFFDRNAFHALLTTVFRLPFDSLDDFLVDGYDAEYEGVRVFHGQIRSRDRSLKRRANRSESPVHWWEEMQILVTDSDPQYFCIQVVMREGDH